MHVNDVTAQRFQTERRQQFRFATHLNGVFGYFYIFINSLYLKQLLKQMVSETNCQSH
jgi:23S rRNA maturation mini-RNase III